MTHLTIGVSGFQGDLEEHRAALVAAADALGLTIDTPLVKRPEHVATLDGLTLPGGESTVMGGLAALNGTLTALRERMRQGLPVLGTCAGLIMLARHAYDRVVGETGQPLLGVLDVEVERNAFGRQHESFEAPVHLPTLGGEPFPGVFIRSPAIRRVGSEAQIFAQLRDSVVGAEQGPVLGLAFHPELASDLRVFTYFLRKVREAR